MINLPLLFYKVYEVDAEHFWKCCFTQQKQNVFLQIYTQQMKKYKVTAETLQCTGFKLPFMFTDIIG